MLVPRQRRDERPRPGAWRVYFDGSTLRGSCLRDLANGVEIVADLELKAYEGPGQTLTLDASKAWGDFSFSGNDGFRYAMLFDPAPGGAPAECTATVVDGPTAPDANQRISVTFECAQIYGLDATGTSVETREVQVTEGAWEATTFQ